MVERYRRRTPLAGLAIGAGAGPGPDAIAPVTVAECAPRAQLALRGDAADPAFVGAVRAVLGVEPPVQANRVEEARGVAVLWLGPDEWLAVFDDVRQREVRESIEAALASQHALVSDVSHSRGAIGLAGPGARDVLARGCSLDLHPSVFGPGRCAQGTLARCHVLIHQRDDVPAFDLYVHRSFMEYAWAWLVDASGPGARIVGAPG